MISIIVPVYNTERYLDRCIQSILAQTYTDFELLLINDGSTDSSGVICDKYAEQDSRVRVFHKENGGVSRARNLGIDKSKGDYVLFLDSDDWLARDTFEILHRTLVREDANCVIFGFYQTSGNIWAPEENRIYATIEDLKKNFAYHLNTELLSSSVNKLYKKELIKYHFPEDISFGEDLIFSLKYLGQCKKVVFIKDALYQHEVYNTSSLTHTFNINRFRDIEIIQTNILDFANDKSDKGLYAKYISDCVRIIRSFMSINIPYIEKRIILDKWINSSCFKKLYLPDYAIIWQNRLLLNLVQRGQYRMAYFLVNWRKLLHLN